MSQPCTHFVAKIWVCACPRAIVLASINNPGHFPNMSAVKLPAAATPAAKRQKPVASARVKRLMGQIRRPGSLASPFEQHLLTTGVHIYFMYGPTFEVETRVLFFDLSIAWPAGIKGYKFGTKGGKNEVANVGHIVFEWPVNPAIVPNDIARKIYNSYPMVKAGDKVQLNNTHYALGMWAWHETHRTFSIAYPGKKAAPVLSILPAVAASSPVSVPAPAPVTMTPVAPVAVSVDIETVVAFETTVLSAVEVL